MQGREALVARNPVGAAVERSILPATLDVRVVELPHRRRDNEGVERRWWQFTIMIIGALEVDQHVSLRLVVADALNEAAARCVGAGERLEIDGASIFDV